MYNPYVGIYKFILALFVVAIHVEPFSGDLAFYFNNGLTRIAVPSFFVLSAFFLFRKLLAKNWNKEIFCKNQLHLAKYYGIWLAFHGPIILYRLSHSSKTPGQFIWQLFQAIFLKGPYGALWFLPATLMGVTLVYLIGKKWGSKICLLLSFPFFFFAVLETEYYVFIKDIDWITELNNFFVMIFGWLANGLTFGFFFCALGFYIASTMEKDRSQTLDIIKLCISFVLLFIETTLVRKFNLGISYGAMITLIPTVYYLVQILLHIKPSNNLSLIRHSKTLQNLSLLIYPLHFAIMETLEFLLKNNTFYMKNTTFQYVVVSIITCGIGWLIIYLSEKPKLHFFKSLYGK